MEDSASQAPPQAPCGAPPDAPQAQDVPGSDSEPWNAQPPGAEAVGGSPAGLTSCLPGPRPPGGALIDQAAVYRLKVVGIPIEDYSEEQLRNLFSLCGNVVEARIVHDKASGRPVGYGYVSFVSKEAADLAISTLDDQLHLPGAATTLSVYYAKKQHDAVARERESCPARNAKLYFCGTPSGFRRDSILALFSAFGRVRHLQVYSDSYGVLSSGTVTMYSTEEAIEAMNSLDGKVLQPGTAPLKVTWAQLSTLPRRSPGGGGPPPPMPKGFTVSYACIPTRVTPSEVAAMFERYGMVLQVVPFAHRREGPPNSRGCGLVVLESERSALDAMEALSGKLTWPGAERPLLVQPFYGAERAGPHQLPTLPEGGGGGGGPTRGRYQPGHHTGARYAAGGGYGDGGGFGRGGGGSGVHDAEMPPPGCAPDAFKVVLSNLPGSYSQADVAALLAPYGSVVAVVRHQGPDPARDGSATVWYATRAMAEGALAALANTVLMAPDGPRKLLTSAPGSRAGAVVHVAGGWGGQPQLGGGGGGQISSLDPASAYAPQVAAYQQRPQPQLQHPHPTYAALQLPAGIHVVPAHGGGGGGGAVHMWQPASTSALVGASTGAVVQGGSRGGAFDMQQLMYVLPSSNSMVPQHAGGGTAPGQLWPMGTAPGMVMAGSASSGGSSQHAIHLLSNTASGSALEGQQMHQGSESSYLSASAPPGEGALPSSSAAPSNAAYTGWLY